MTTVLFIIIGVLVVALFACIIKISISGGENEEGRQLIVSENAVLKDNLAEKRVEADKLKEANSKLRKQLQDLKISHEQTRKELAVYKDKEVKNKEQLRQAREKKNQKGKKK